MKVDEIYWKGKKLSHFTFSVKLFLFLKTKYIINIVLAYVDARFMSFLRHNWYRFPVTFYYILESHICKISFLKNVYKSNNNYRYIFFKCVKKWLKSVLFYLGYSTKFNSSIFLVRLLVYKKIEHKLFSFKNNNYPM